MTFRLPPPTDCFATGPFGAGPFPPLGWENVLGCPANPDNAGYGGVAWTSFPTPEDPAGGGSFGLSPFGGAVYPAPPIPVDRMMPVRSGSPTRDGSPIEGDSGWGGMDFGGDPYGLGGGAPTGNLEGAISLNGYEIQVFFIGGTGPMDAGDYSLSPTMGAPVTVLRVREAGTGTVILTHTGTTLGGFYTLTVDFETVTESVELYTKGEMPPFVIQPTDSGEDVVFTFGEAMLSASEGSDIEDPSAYDFISTPDYPIFLTPVQIDHPWLEDESKVHMTVKGMTSLQYQCTLSPALAWDWDGTVFPDADPSLIGREVNPGQGTSTIAEGTMWLARPIFAVYGWEFLDKTGRLNTVATFRADVEFNADSMVCHPPFSAFAAPKVGDWVIEDGPGGTQVNIQLRRSQDEDWLRIWSGSFNTFVRQPWSVGTNTITVIRNTKAGIWAFLFNGTPFLSVPLADLDGPAEGDDPGVTWRFTNEWFSLQAFNIRRVKLTASSTVWSGSWNFMHEGHAEFIGSDVLTRDHVMTRRGPLVKNWGDATPATKTDVEILVCGVPVEIASVNPFIGKIIPEIPIPLMPIGDPFGDVKLDYHWQASPVMEMAALNTPGLVLNQWDRKEAGRHDPPAHGQPYTAWIENGVAFGFIATEPAHDFPKCRVCGSDLVDIGVPFWWDENSDCPNYHIKLIPSWEDLNPIRFPMGTVLGPAPKVDPLFIGHRYIGFQRDQSALLNSPTSLLLNMNPMASSVDNFARDVQGVSFSYNGMAAPNSSDPVWILTGTDAGHLDVGQGTWTLVDNESGPWSSDNPAVAFWSKEVDLTFPAAITTVARFQIEDADSLFSSDSDIFEPDGVFTGVSFGIHDNHRLWLVGALLINGLEHVGMLKDSRRIHFLDGWYVGPTASATLSDWNIFTMLWSEAPSDFQAGRRFQVLSGPQAGIYTATEVLRHCDGTMTVGITPAAVPADPTRWGNNLVSVVFETPWSGKPSTYRLVVDTDQEVAVLSISGSTTAMVLTLDGQTASIPLPAETALLLSTTGTGQAFWGSLSTLATSRSKWSFIQNGIAPDFSTLAQGSVQVATEMSILPEEDPNNPWFVTQGFGTSSVPTAGTLLLKSISASETLDSTFGYTRIEPFLTDSVSIDVRAQFRVDSGTAAGDAQVVLNNGDKEVRLATLVYAEGFSGTEYRRLVGMPSVSISGILDPTDQGWTLDPASTGASSNDEWDMTVVAGDGESQRWFTTLDTSSLGALDSGWRILELQMVVDAVTPDGFGNTGIGLDADIGPGHALGIHFATGKVQLVDAVGMVVQDWTFNWNDGEYHSYRVSALSGVVSLAIDDVVLTPTLTIGSFVGGAGTGLCLFGVSPLVGVSSTTRWRAVAVSCAPGFGCHRTFGIWNGGTKGHINSWEIPRKDETTAPNSAEIGPDIEDMNWQSATTEVRLLLAPDWGVTMYRPDLPLPPYYQPESGTPGTGFANQTNEPSAGWINLEWPNLPRVPSSFGFVSFGALEQESSTRQRWNWVRYRIFKSLLENHIAPEHMVLNQAMVATSGEMTKDVEQEVVIIQTLTAQSLTLLPTNLNASSVWKVIDGDRILTRESWVFDSSIQLLTLNDGVVFSAEHAAVTVVFIPGGPITKTYLGGQPLLDGITILNNSTPPIPKSQTMASTKEIVYGSLLNDPAETLGGVLLLNDPYRVLTLKNDPASLYEDLEFIQVDNGGFEGVIAIAGEGTLPEGFSGWANTKEDLLLNLSNEGTDFIYEPAGSIGCEEELPGFKNSTPLCPTDELVGRAVGAHVMDFRGTKFTERLVKDTRAEMEQGGGMPGFILHAAGGSYMGPVVNAGGMITGAAALGGRVGPGTTILMPNWPSQNVVAGRDGGKVRRRTEWVMRLSAVSQFIPDSIGGWDEVEVPLVETVQWGLVDNTAPSRPASWRNNPNSLANPNGRGSVLMVMTGAGDYSHLGPWGGLGSLLPTPDSGFFEFNPASLQDGDQVSVEKEPGGIAVLFTARTVPTLPNEFAIAPAPHVGLADCINNDPVIGALVTATAGLTWTGDPSILVEAILPVTVMNMISLWSSNETAIWLVGISPEISDRGLLTGGAKMTQGSLVAGGNFTVRNGFNDPKLGLVCLGGTVLPAGLETVQILNAP